ncbi:hypothetical protein K438DRAFT_672588 [Mycena galopus ATCC 62051]|nr:hypothetical protein K438DRAFT_672588 [Mycena galopus ATCC 62051]
MASALGYTLYTPNYTRGDSYIPLYPISFFLLRISIPRRGSEALRGNERPRGWESRILKIFWVFLLSGAIVCRIAGDALRLA